MKKLFTAFLCCVIILSSMAFPASSAIASPYTLIPGGCITDVTMSSSTTILDEVNYFTATVTSHVQGVSTKTAIPYSVYGAVGSSDTKMFVYSVGSSNNLDYANRTVLDIVTAFERDNPAWNAIAAINGGFFDNETSKTASVGEPEDISIQCGDVYKGSFGPAGGRGMVGTTDEGNVVYYTYGKAYFDRGWGREMITRKSHTVRILDDNRLVTDDFEVYADGDIIADQAILVTPDSAPQNLSLYRVFVVKCSTYRRAHIGSLGIEFGTLGYFLEGEVTAVRGGSASDKPDAGYALIGFPMNMNPNSLKIGTKLKCERTVVGVWSEVTNAVGFKQQILAEGNILLKNCYGTYNTGGNKAETLVWTDDIYDYPHCWKHRTALGFKADGSPVLLVAKKSSHTGSYKNLGASYYELGEQLKSLGCVNGFLLDGGGSSTFVVRNADGTFKNVFVGEGSGRKVANAVIIAVRDPSVPLPGEEFGLSGSFTSYPAAGDATLTLKSGDNVISTLSFAKTATFGLSTQSFEFENIVPGTYDLVIERKGHLSYTVSGIVIDSADVDLRAHESEGVSSITLLAGDLDNDGCIDLSDVVILTSSNTYGKPYDEAVAKYADINGDGCFDLSDLQIVTSTNSYGKSKIKVEY